MQTETVIFNSNSKVLKLPTELLYPGELFARTVLNSADFRRFCENIRKYGVLEPLLVTKTPFGYRIVSGERRFYAARKLKLASLPCIILKRTDGLKLSLICNIQRKQLSLFDEADILSYLLQRDCTDVFSLASSLSVTPGYIKDRLSLGIFSPRERAKAEAEELTLEELAQLAVYDAVERGKALDVLIAKKRKERELSPEPEPKPEPEEKPVSNRKNAKGSFRNPELILNSFEKLVERFEVNGIPLKTETVTNGSEVKFIVTIS